MSSQKDKYFVKQAPSQENIAWGNINKPVSAEIFEELYSEVIDYLSGKDVYVTDGYKSGGAMFKLADDGKSISPVWTEKTLSVNHGGAVLVDGKIFGANKSALIGVDAKTGKALAKGRATGKGSIIYCDGLLYTYGERGHVGLIDPKSTDFTPISKFKISLGSGAHWAHPVISGGNLYIRHGDALMSFSIKEKSS